MSDPPERERVARQLRAALDADDPAEKNYHVRQALQILSVEGGSE